MDHGCGYGAAFRERCGVQKGGKRMMLASDKGLLLTAIMNLELSKR
jgi:hypothetical protein